MSDTNTFRDYIPEGESTGGITSNGYQDFVPEAEVVEGELPIETVEPKTKKGGKK